MFPVRRGARDDEAFITAETILARGGVVAMYPEGGRSRTGTLAERARPGIGRLVLDTGAPVVPIAIHGSSKIRNWKRLRFPRVSVRFGEPMRFEAEPNATRERQQEVADEIFAADPRALRAPRQRADGASEHARARGRPSSSPRAPDTPGNLAAADRLVREAAARGAQLVLLPEKWPLWASGEQMRAGAEPLDGPRRAAGRASCARELAIDLVAGSFSEIGADGRLHNTSLHITPTRRDPRGLPQDPHVRRHGRAASSTASPRSTSAGRGDRRLARPTTGVELGMTICYDLRFPELYRILALRGARVLLVPAAFTMATTRDHWETLLRARAIENQAFVDRRQPDRRVPAGPRRGRALDDHRPVGRRARAGADDGPCVIVAELDLDGSRDPRSLPSLANRRPAAYRWPREPPAPRCADDPHVRRADLID